MKNRSNNSQLFIFTGLFLSLIALFNYLFSGYDLEVLKYLGIKELIYSEESIEGNQLFSHSVGGNAWYDKFPAYRSQQNEVFYSGVTTSAQSASDLYYSSSNTNAFSPTKSNDGSESFHVSQGGVIIAENYSEERHRNKDYQSTDDNRIEMPKSVKFLAFNSIKNTLYVKSNSFDANNSLAPSGGNGGSKPPSFVGGNPGDPGDTGVPIGDGYLFWLACSLVFVFYKMKQVNKTASLKSLFLFLKPSDFLHKRVMRRQ